MLNIVMLSGDSGQLKYAMSCCLQMDVIFACKAIQLPTVSIFDA